MSNFATRTCGGRCMKRLLTFMLLTAAMLPTLGQAQTVNICDRTPTVVEHILALEAIL